jgi:hypothetical protein
VTNLLFARGVQRCGEFALRSGVACRQGRFGHYTTFPIIPLMRRQ